jgi:hypothetical protein
VCFFCGYSFRHETHSVENRELLLWYILKLFLLIVNIAGKR